MTTSDFFELKDTASECSMDSAYQSQSGASRRGARKPDGPAQDNRSRMSTQFVGSDIYSPSLSSDNYPTFPEQTLDMSQMSHPSTGTWEATEGPITYANYTTGQDYSQYAAANMSRFTPSTTVNGSSQWAVSDAQFPSNPFTFTSYPTVHNSNEMMFNAASSQRQWNSPSFDPTERPSAVRSSSTYTAQEDSRRASAHENNFGAFVATPTSTTSVHFPQSADFEQARPTVSR